MSPLRQKGQASRAQTAQPDVASKINAWPNHFDMRMCAYCSKEADLTREHIVPKFLYEQHPLAKFGYNFKADTFLSWEAQIKDVCQKCNNDLLSKVDAYGKRFCLENRIDTFVTTERECKLTYDFDWLSR